MKKIYLLSSAVMLSVAAFAQSGPLGHGVTKGTKAFHHATSAERLTCPDTTGIVNFVDFQPEYAPSGQSLIFGYSGGGYVYGNNVSSLLKTVAQGYVNLNGTPVKVTDVLVFFVAMENDLGSSATSKVTFKLYNMAANRACNDAGGTYNLTTLNWPGPVATASASADLLFSDIDTGQVNGFNVINFATPPTFSGDFAIAMETAGLAAGDTVGLLCDDIGSAANLDYAFHYVGGSYNKWMCTDNVFSATGTGDVDNDIAMFAILCDATGVNEFFNGMKLTTYPNPAVDKTTIEYSLEKDSKNVALIVYDQTGRKVLENKYDAQSAGNYKVNLETVKLSSGMYYYQLRANGLNLSKKFAVTK